MYVDLAYVRALAEARSCPAALADGAADVDESSYFERLLISTNSIPTLRRPTRSQVIAKT